MVKKIKIKNVAPPPPSKPPDSPLPGIETPPVLCQGAETTSVLHKGAEATSGLRQPDGGGEGWDSWYEDKVEYLPLHRTPPDGTGNGSRMPKRRTRDAYEKCRQRYLVTSSFRLQPIQEAAVSDLALTVEDDLDKGKVVTSQYQDGDGHVTMFNVSGIDENRNIIPLTVFDKDRPDLANGVKKIEQATDNVNNADDPDVVVIDYNGNMTSGNGNVTSGEPEVVIVEKTIPPDSQNGGPSLPSSAQPTVKRRNTGCIALVVTLVLVGLASSAIAIYFALSALSEGSL